LPPAFLARILPPAGNSLAQPFSSFRLDRPQHKQVIEADIVSPLQGSRAHAQEIDGEFIEAGRAPYAQRIATTVFLHSLVQTGQSGVEPGDLRLAVLQPGDDPALAQVTLFGGDFRDSRGARMAEARGLEGIGCGNAL